MSSAAEHPNSDAGAGGSPPPATPPAVVARTVFAYAKARVWGGLGVATLLILWALVATRWPPHVLPGPTKVASTLWELRRTLLDAALATTLRVGEGYLGGATLGLALALLGAAWPACRRQLQPIHAALRGIPPFAWTPLLLLWLGIGDASAVVVVVLAAVFPVYAHAAAGLERAPPELLAAARNLGASSREVTLRVRFPAALPMTLTGLRLGGTLAWMSVVAAEIVGADRGLGQVILDARNLARPDIAMAGMVALGALAALSDLLLGACGARLLRWGVVVLSDVSLPSGADRLPRGALGFALLLAWEILGRTLSLDPRTRMFLPLPSEVAIATIRLARDGSLAEAALRSSVRVGLAALVAVVVGLPLGALIALRPRLGAVLEAPLRLLRPMPPVAWVPLTLLWFGVTELQQVVVLVLAAVQIAILGATSAVKGVPGAWIDAARNLGATPRDVLLRVALPASRPALWTTAREAVAVAWFVLVAAELLAASPGLGAVVLQGRDMLEPARAFVGMAALAACAALSDAALGALASSRWRRG